MIQYLCTIIFHAYVYIGWCFQEADDGDDEEDAGDGDGGY